MKTSQVAVGFALIIAVFSACSTVPNQIPFQNLGLHVSSDKEVAIHGCLAKTMLGGLALFENCQDAMSLRPERAVDLGFSGEDQPELGGDQVVCAEVVGKFYPLEEGSIVTGPSFGELGLLGVKRWSIVDCE